MDKVLTGKLATLVTLIVYLVANPNLAQITCIGNCGSTISYRDCSNYSDLASCLASLPDNTHVYIPAGNWNIPSSGITIQSNNIRISGAGQGVTVLNVTHPTNTEYALRLRGNSITIEKLTINGNRTLSSNCYPWQLVWIEYGDNIKLDDVKIHYSPGFGIAIGYGPSGYYATNIDIINSDISYNGCIYTTPSVKNGAAINGGWSVAPYRPSNIRIVNSRFTYNHTVPPNDTSGSIGLNATNVIIHGNYFEGNLNVGGGEIGPLQVTGTNLQWIIKNNIFVHNNSGGYTETTHALELSGYKVITEGNHFINYNHSNEIAIAIQSIGSDRHGDQIIANNIIQNCNNGVRLIATGSIGPRDIKITNNWFTNCYICLYIDFNASNIRVDGNTIVNSTITVDNYSSTVFWLNNFPGGFWGLPNNAGNGSLHHCTDCIYGSVPCSAGGNGALARRLNDQWRCD